MDRVWNERQFKVRVSVREKVLALSTREGEKFALTWGRGKNFKNKDCDRSREPKF